MSQPLLLVVPARAQFNVFGSLSLTFLFLIPSVCARPPLNERSNNIEPEAEIDPELDMVLEPEVDPEPSDTESEIDFGYRRVEGVYELVQHPDIPLANNKGIAEFTASLHLGNGSGQVYIFGGRIGSNEVSEPSDHLLRYDIEQLVWNEIGKKNPWPSARSGHSAAVGIGDSSLLIFGGDSDSTGCVLNDLWMFDIPSQTWREIAATEVQDQRPQPMYNHGSVIREGVFFVFGGLGPGSGTMWSIDVSEGSSETWIKLYPSGPIPSECANAYVLIEDVIYVCDFEDDFLFMFVFDSLTWTKVNGINTGSMTSMSQMLYITCGYNSAGPTNDVRRFDTKATDLPPGSEWGFIEEEVIGDSGPDGDAFSPDNQSDEQDDVVEDDSVQVDSLNSNVESQESGSSPTPHVSLPKLSGHASVMVDDSIFVLGGWDSAVPVEGDDIVFSNKLFELKLKPVPATSMEQQR